MCGLFACLFTSVSPLLFLSLVAVMVWLQYTQFAMDKLSAVPEGLSFPREVFERAIVGCGLHVAQAGLVWDAYLAMEIAILDSFQVSQWSGERIRVAGFYLGKFVTRKLVTRGCLGKSIAIYICQKN